MATILAHCGASAFVASEAMHPLTYHAEHSVFFFFLQIQPWMLICVLYPAGLVSPAEHVQLFNVEYSGQKKCRRINLSSTHHNTQFLTRFLRAAPLLCAMCMCSLVSLIWGGEGTVMRSRVPIKGAGVQAMARSSRITGCPWNNLTPENNAT